MCLTRRHLPYLFLLVLLVFVGLCSRAEAHPEEECRHGTLPCFSATVAKMRAWGWDFHQQGEIVMPADAVYYHGYWAAPTTGTPAVRYRVRVEFVVEGLREVEFFLTSAGDSARIQCVGIDEMDREGPWSGWSW